MKATKYFFLVALMAVAILLSAGVQPAQAQTAKSKGSEEVTITTSALCGMCKTRLETAIYNTKGVKAVNLDLDSKALTVKYNPKKVSADKLRTVVSNTGYRADDVPANEIAFNKLPNCCKSAGACSKTESSCGDKH
ncbi:MAG TPA: heavy-metal-associated domain-containing protein [Chitinophagales bacterium]|nr:heavy-metal-associated domain-containing protein [Chitinophagales bacterium]HRK26168.1 heavy-metal-associated domain-containing protein [Chitinophagales bacterium]